MKTTSTWPYRWADLPWLAGTAAIYALLSKFVLTYYSTNGLVTVFWPGAGVALAALLLGGGRYWIGIYIGAAAGHVWTGAAIGEALAVSVGSALEPLIGVWLLSRRGAFDVSLSRFRDLFRLIYLAGVASPGVCALLGVGVLTLFGHIAPPDLGKQFAQWWMGDTLGVVVVAPLVLTWQALPRQRWNRLEALFLFGLSFLVGQVIFLNWFHGFFSQVNRGYWMYMVVSWAAVRFGLHGVLLVISVATVQALAGAAQGLGFFGNDLLRTGLTNFWAYTMILSTVGMSLATIIAERGAVTNRLRSSDDRLRLAKTAAGLGVFDHDLPDGTHEWDERMRELWGFTPEEPITFAKFMAGVHPDDRAATQAAVDRALDPHGDGAYHAEYRVMDAKDGHVRQVMAYGRVMFEHGRAIRFSGTVADVSMQKRLERELQGRRSEMELLINQQVAAQTAAAIAHELNQPLVSISAYSEAALRMLRTGAKSPEKLARALEGAMTQAQRAGQTLHELLDFLHKGDAASEPVDLNEVIQEALAMAVEGGYGGFRPVVELEPELRPVLANRLQLQKILVNLLHNGVEAMRSAGVDENAITIGVRTAAGRHMAQVTVRDSGPGLDAETADRIFEPFFTTKSQGLGLGLAISRALIEAQGGQLWADPDSGPGATFHFTLPFAP